MTRKYSNAPTAAALVAAVFLAACDSTPKAGQPLAQCDLNTPAPTSLPPTKDPAAAPTAHALHNVHRLNDRIISGAVPEDDAAFEELHAMSIKTIISVDGASPDVARAQAHGMRYVHIPITYAEVTEEERLKIARALRDLPGPVYVHCHHGKHRSPAAVAAAAVALGEITPEQGVAFMKEAGTAPNYTGLYACVATATVMSATAIDSAPAEFPSVRRAQGIVAAMVETDIAFENIGLIKAAGWKTPGDHPDLVPASESGRLADNLRFTGEDKKAAGHGAGFVKKLAEAVTAATALEDAIVAGAPAADLDGKYKLVQASCKDCHATYRDKPAAPPVR